MLRKNIVLVFGTVVLLISIGVSSIFTKPAGAVQAPTSVNTHQIEGYASSLSVAPGGYLDVYVSLPNTVSTAQSRQTGSSFSYQTYDAKTVEDTNIAPIDALSGTAVATNQAYTTTSYLDGLQWTPSFRLNIPATQKSGVYSVKLTDPLETNSDLKQAWVTFVVKPSSAATANKVAMLVPTNTYAAYNFWPGEANGDTSGAFYDGCAGHTGVVTTTFLRPSPVSQPTRVHNFGSCASGAVTNPDHYNVIAGVEQPRTNGAYLDFLRNDVNVPGDMAILRWLDKQSQSYSTISDWDLDRDWNQNQKLTILDPAVTPVMIIPSHSEYWSQNMYDATKQYMDKGGNVMVLGGNTLYHKVTLSELNGNKTMTKVTLNSDDWQGPTLNSKVQALLGLQYNDPLSVTDPSNPGAYCMSRIAQTNTQHWLYKTPTAVATGTPMGGGSVMTTPSNMCTFNTTGSNHAYAVGWETDYMHVRFARQWVQLGTVIPSDLANSLSSTSISQGQNKIFDMFYFQRPSGGSVFVAGSLTFGQSLLWDADNGNHALTTLLNNVMGRMSKRTFSDFTAASTTATDSAGKPDLLVSNPGESQLRLYRGTGANGVDSIAAQPGGDIIPSSQGYPWGTYKDILPIGDFDGDGKADLLTRDTSGQIHLFKGDGAGGFVANTGQVIDYGWDAGLLPQLVTPGDWDGDGYPDLIALKNNGAVLLYRGAGNGTFIQGATQLGTISGNVTLVAIGDYDYNVMGYQYATPGKPDLLVRDNSNGYLRLYHGNRLDGNAGNIGFAGIYDVINYGWTGLKLTAIGDINDDSNPDLLACNQSSTSTVMNVYHGTGGLGNASYISGIGNLGYGWNCSTSRYIGVW